MGDAGYRRIKICRTLPESASQKVLKRGFDYYIFATEENLKIMSISSARDPARSLLQAFIGYLELFNIIVCTSKICGNISNIKLIIIIHVPSDFSDVTLSVYSTQSL